MVEVVEVVVVVVVVVVEVVEVVEVVVVVVVVVVGVRVAVVVTVVVTVVVHELSPKLLPEKNFLSPFQKKTLAETVNCIPKGLRKGNPFHGPFAQLSYIFILGIGI